MDKRLLALAVALLCVFAGVRIADPRLDDEEVTVAFEDGPAVVAADSVRRMQTRKVTIELRTAVDSRIENETYEKRAEIRVEHDIRRYRAVHSTDNDSNGELGFFGTEGMGWTESPYTDWGRAPSSRYPGFGSVMNPTAMGQSNARVLVDNETTFAVRFEGEDANEAVEGMDAHTRTATPGRFDLYIDKQRKLPTRAVRAYEIPKRNATVRIRYRFTRYGETDVERPEGVPKISIWELLGDIYYN